MNPNNLAPHEPPMATIDPAPPCLMTSPTKSDPRTTEAQPRNHQEHSQVTAEREKKAENKEVGKEREKKKRWEYNID